MCLNKSFLDNVYGCKISSDIEDVMDKTLKPFNTNYTHTSSWVLSEGTKLAPPFSLMIISGLADLFCSILVLRFMFSGKG